jgi:hypothetical protein
MAGLGVNRARCTGVHSCATVSATVRQLKPAGGGASNVNGTTAGGGGGRGHGVGSHASGHLARTTSPSKVLSHSPLAACSAHSTGSGEAPSPQAPAS